MAEIYRTAAENMTTGFYEDEARDILDATTRAGRELVETMTISAETLGRIPQPFVDPAAFAQMGKLFWKTCIAEGVTPQKFDEENMVPRPDSLATFMRLFPAGLNADAAGDRKVILQFHFPARWTVPAISRWPRAASRRGRAPAQPPISPSRPRSMSGWIS